MRRTISAIDTGACLILIEADMLDLSCLSNIHRYDIPDIRRATHTKLKVSGTIRIHLHMCESQTYVNFGVINKLAMQFFVGAMYIDRLIKSIHPSERKIVPVGSSPLPVLTVQEVRDEAE